MNPLSLICLILFVGDVFQPVDGFAVELFLDGDVGHGGGGGGAVPVLFAGGNQTTSPGRISSMGPPQRCTRPQPAVTIRVWPSGWVCQAVRAPGSKVTLAPATRAGGGGLKSGIDADGAGEPVGRAFGGGLRAAAFDFHGLILDCRWFDLEVERGPEARPTLRSFAPVFRGSGRLAR